MDSPEPITAADDRVAEMKVPGTSCFVVSGKYRVNMDTPHSSDELIDLKRARKEPLLESLAPTLSRGLVSYTGYSFAYPRDHSGGGWLD